MMGQITYSRFHGKGHEAIAGARGLGYDYKNTCTGCGGSGYMYEYEPSFSSSSNGRIQKQS